MFMILLVVSNSFAGTYDCTFTHRNTQNGLEKEKLKLTFAISEIDDKAHVIGNTGTPSEVFHIDKGFGKTFIEITDLGNVMTTTIDKKMKAVHSRNTVGFSGKLIPQQFYGSCTKRQLNK
jgi:hypothetical protein